MLTLFAVIAPFPQSRPGLWHESAPLDHQFTDASDGARCAGSPIELTARCCPRPAAATTDSAITSRRRHEGPGGGRGRARACAVLGARAHRPWSSELVLRARQHAIAREATLRAGRGRRHRRASSRFCRRAADRARGARAGAAAGAGPGRPAARRPASRRSARRAAAARLEGSKAFAKAFCARHGIPTAPFRTFTREQARRGQGLCARARRADRGQGGRARRRQGRDGRGARVEEALAALDAAFGGAFGAAGATRRDRGVPGRRGGEPVRAGRRRAACWSSAPRRTTSAPSTATAGRTPAAWAPTRRRRA